jgi:integrase
MRIETRSTREAKAPARAGLLCFPSRAGVVPIDASSRGSRTEVILPRDAVMVGTEDWQLTPAAPLMPKKPRRPRRPPVSLSDAQLLALLTIAQKHRVRDWVMILLTYWHGLRASETIALRAADFNLSEWTVKIRRGKGSAGGGDDAPQEQTLQEHENPLLNERDAVAAWLADRGRFGVKGGARRQSGQNPGLVAKTGQSCEIVRFSNLLFPIQRQHFWAIVHGYALAAGIPQRKCKTHMLKHTIAKHLVRAGHPLNEIQEWMGWRSIETMNWYTRADEEELGNRIGDSIRAKQGLRQVQQGSLFS